MATAHDVFRVGASGPYGGLNWGNAAILRQPLRSYAVRFRLPSSSSPGMQRTRFRALTWETA